MHYHECYVLSSEMTTTTMVVTWYSRQQRYVSNDEVVTMTHSHEYVVLSWFVAFATLYCVGQILW